MSKQSPKKRITFRVTVEDSSLFDQAAERMGLPTSAWMQAVLKKEAIQEIYGVSSEDDEGGQLSSGEQALMRAVLMILQIVNVNVPEETQKVYHRRARAQIERMNNEPE